MTILVVNRLAIDPRESEDALISICREGNNSPHNRIVIIVNNWEQSLHSSLPTGVVELYRSRKVSAGSETYRYFVIIRVHDQLILRSIVEVENNDPLFPIWQRIMTNHPLAWQPAQDQLA